MLSMARNSTKEVVVKYPRVVWTSGVYRLVERDSGKYSCESKQGVDAMGQETWLPESIAPSLLEIVQALGERCAKETK